MNEHEVLAAPASIAADYFDSSAEQPIAPTASMPTSATRWRRLPEAPQDSVEVLDGLAQQRSHGDGIRTVVRIVIGGALPAALAADWLVSTWDQNAGLAARPDLGGRRGDRQAWMIELLGLPAQRRSPSLRAARWRT